MHLTKSILPVCLLFSLFACQQGTNNTPILVANAGTTAANNRESSSEQQKPVSTDLIFQSDDEGQTWEDISADLPAGLLIMRIMAGKNGEIYLGAERGLYRYSPPPAATTWSNELPLDDQVVGIFEGKSGLYASWFKSGFFKNLPGKNNWMPMDNPQDNQFVWSAVETPEGAVVISNENGIYKTTDDGASWKLVSQKAAPYNLHQEDGVLYGVCYEGILRSTDGGEQWNWSLEDGGSAKSIHLLDGRSVVFMCKEGAWTLKSLSDSILSQNWNHLAKGIADFKYINDFLQAGDYLYCSHDGGVSRSNDRGKTWELLLPAPKDNLIYRIAVSGKKIFVVKTIGC